MDSLSRRSPRRRRGTFPGSVIGWEGGVWAVIFGLVTTVLWKDRLFANDWLSLWVAGKMVRGGDTAHLYDSIPENFSAIGGDVWPRYVADILEQEHLVDLTGHPFVHSPLVAYAISPLTTIMSYTTSTLLLTFASAVALVVLIASSYYLWFKRPMPFKYLAPASLVLSVSEPAQFIFIYGQTSLLIYGGALFALAASKRYPVWAGLTLAVVALVKLTPVSLIVLLALFKGRRKAAIVAAVGTVAGVIAAFVLGGPALFAAWVDNLKRISSVGLVNPNNLSFDSIFMADRQTDYLTGVLTIVDPPAIYGIAQFALVAAVALVVVGLAVWRRHGAFELLATGAVVLSSLYSSIVWTHYFVMVVAIIAGIAAMRCHEYLKIGLPVLIAPLYFRPFTGFIDPIQPGVLVGTYVLLAALLVLYALGRYPGREANEHVTDKARAGAYDGAP
ncbi:hypothetical protein GCM10028828_10210 [Corynebacterium tapiri]